MGRGLLLDEYIQERTFDLVQDEFKHEKSMLKWYENQFKRNKLPILFSVFGFVGIVILLAMAKISTLFFLLIGFIGFIVIIKFMNSYYKKTNILKKKIKSSQERMTKLEEELKILWRK